ncbi:MAG: Bug family tripartite tricarboxylate transporter substrate binding protein [Limnohabitans sp.]
MISYLASRIVTILRWGLFAAAIMHISAVQAQDWPNARPIKLVVPGAAASSVDTVTRLFGLFLQTKLGANVVVENRPGALGAIAASYVAKAAPDGYIFIMGAQDTQILLALVNKNTQFSSKDFIPVAKISEASLLIAATPKIPFDNVKDMITHAKLNPGRLSFASGGTGGIQHLSVEVVKNRANIDMLHVPYKSATDAANGFMASDVDLISASPTFLAPLIRQGKAKGIAIMREKRHPLLPNVPTFAEAGIPSLNVASWVGIFAPLNTPVEIVAKMSDSVMEFVNSPEMRPRLEATGQEPAAIPYIEFNKYMAAEWVKWEGVVKAARIESVN